MRFHLRGRRKRLGKAGEAVQSAEMKSLPRIAAVVLAALHSAFANEAVVEARSDVRFLVDGASYVGLIQQRHGGYSVTNLAGAIAAADVAEEMRQHGLFPDNSDGAFFLFFYDPEKVVSETKDKTEMTRGYGLSITDFKKEPWVLLPGHAMPAGKFRSLMEEVLKEDVGTERRASLSVTTAPKFELSRNGAEKLLTALLEAKDKKEMRALFANPDRDLPAWLKFAATLEPLKSPYVVHLTSLCDDEPPPYGCTAFTVKFGENAPFVIATPFIEAGKSGSLEFGNLGGTWVLCPVPDR
jgi:hypothetical protein